MAVCARRAAPVWKCRVARVLIFALIVVFAPQGRAAERASVLQVRPVRRAVDLSGKARPVAVLVPAPEGAPCRAEPGVAEAWRTAGERLVAALRGQCGVDAALTDDPAQALPDTHSVIALGNVNTNELVARLFFNHGACADSIFPGDGEFALRTVFEPYPWHGQGDVILIECGDPSGAERGIAELLKRIAPETKSLAWTQAVSKPAPPEEKGGTEPTLLDWQKAVDTYFLTGDEVHARRAIQVLEALDALYAKKYAADDDVPISWPEEMQSDAVFAAWDAFEEHPALSDEQRLRFTRVFLKALRGLTGHVNSWDEIGKDDLVAWNHTTFPLCGVYFGARYFQSFYPSAETKEYLRKAESVFMGQARSWKPWEDASTYLYTTMTSCCGYWLAEWRLDWFTNGNAARFADYVIAVSDNRGFGAGFGDSGLTYDTRSITANVPISYWWTRDPRYLWVLNHVSGGAWKNPFHRGIAPVPDTAHIGLQRFPLDAQLYEITGRRPVYTETLVRPNIARDAAFDKIAFRQSWSPEAQYLLLDGFGRGKHLHYDTNAIITYVDRNQRWLLDHDYLVRNSTEHAMASVICNGRSDALVPSCAGLRAFGDGARVAMTATEVRDYLGLDWVRSLFWRKGRYFVVMDRFTARKAAAYDIDLTWKLADEGTTGLVAPGVFLADRSTPAQENAAPARFWLRCADTPEERVTRYSTVRLPIPLVKLWQRTGGDLRAGDEREIANLFYTDTPTAAETISLRRIGRQTVLVTGSEPALAACGDIALDGIATDAELLFAAPDYIAWVGATTLQVGGRDIPLNDRTSGDMEVPEDARKGLHDLLSRLASKATPDLARDPAETLPAAQPVWTYTAEGGPIQRLRAADLDGDGHCEILAAVGNQAVALKSDGQPLWTYAFNGRCNDLNAGEADPTPGLEVAAVGRDKTLVLLDSGGAVLHRETVRATDRRAHFGAVAVEPTAVAVYRTDPAAAPFLFVATRNYDIITYDPSLARRNLVRDIVQHGGIEFQALDVNGDGLLEVFCTNHYGNLSAVDAHGDRVTKYYTSIGDMEAAFGDLDGNGVVSAVYGSSTGDLHCQTLTKERPWKGGATERWRFDNYGYAVRRLRVGDADGDGRNEVFVASGTGFLYVLDKDGKERWRRRIGADVTDVLLLDHPEWKIVCADRSRTVTFLNGRGDRAKILRVDGEPRFLLSANGLLVVGLSDRIAALPLP